MKKLLLSLVAATGMVVGAQSALAESVTYTFKTDTDITIVNAGVSGGGGACELSKENVTLDCTDGYYGGAGKTLNVYKNSTMTITAPGLITSIALNYNGKVYPFDEALGDGTKGSKFSESGAHPADYTPETPATSIVLTNPNGGKTELLDITINYEAGSLIHVTSVSLDQTSASLSIGKTLELTATVAPENASVKSILWSSDDETVATVSNGVVTAIAEGEATITATSVDGGLEASCVITVLPKVIPPYYALRFKEADSDSGDSSSKYAANATAIFEEGAEYVSSVPTLSNVFAARTGCGAKWGTSKANGQLVIKLAEAVDNALVEISAAMYGDEEGAEGFEINGETYPLSAGNKVFEKIYIEEANLTSLDIATVAKRAYINAINIYPEGKWHKLAIGSTKWATLYVGFPFALPEGMKAYIVNDVTSEAVAIQEVTGVVPAYTGVMLNAPAGAYTLTYTAETADDLSENLLKGLAEDGFCAPDVNYVLGDNGDGTVSFGLYHGTTLKANHAYLPGDVVPAGARPALVIDGVTSIEQIATETAVKMYDLQGRQINSLQKGINIVGGKKVIVK